MNKIILKLNTLKNIVSSISTQKTIESDLKTKNCGKSSTFAAKKL